MCFSQVGLIRAHPALAWLEASSVAARRYRSDRGQPSSTTRLSSGPRRAHALNLLSLLIIVGHTLLVLVAILSAGGRHVDGYHIIELVLVQALADGRRAFSRPGAPLRSIKPVPGQSYSRYTCVV